MSKEAYKFLTRYSKIYQHLYRGQKTSGGLQSKREAVFLTIMNLECQGCDLLSDDHEGPERKTEHS